MARFGERLGQGVRATVVTTSGSDNCDIDEAQKEPSTGNACDAAVAVRALVITSLGHSISRGGAGSSAGLQFEAQVDSTTSGGELERLTSASVMADEARIIAMSRSASLVEDFASSSRTSRKRGHNGVRGCPFEK